MAPHTGDANDPDCSLGTANSPAQQLSLGGASGTSSINASQGGKNSSITNNTTNSTTTITYSIPVYTNNTTTTVTITLGPPAPGTGVQTVTGVKVDTSPGVGDQNDPNANPDPLAQCGVAGKPPCNAKIDESGTPSDGSLQTQRDAFDTAAKGYRDQIGTAPGTFGPGEFAIGFTLALPTPVMHQSDHHRCLQGQRVLSAVREHRGGALVRRVGLVCAYSCGPVCDRSWRT